MRASILLVFALVSAGCVVQSAEDLSPLALPALPVPGEPIVQDHDHTDPTLHMDSHNLRLVAHVKPWGDGSDYGQGTVNELAVNGQYVYVSRSNPEGGFAIVDLSDPRSPKVVGDFRSEGGADIEVTSDGQYALLMTQRTLPGQQTLDQPTARTPRGIYVVDVRDKTNPTLSSFFPLPHNGPHTAFYFRAGPDLELVAIQTYDFLPNPATGSVDQLLLVSQRVILTELVRTTQGARLETRGMFQLNELPTPGKEVFPHDAYIEVHPETGERLMYVAYWDAGLRVVNIDNLQSPREVASFHDFAPSLLAQMHDARPFPTKINGRHVTVVGPEIVTADEVGQLTFIDTTDPKAPTKLGYWTVQSGLVVDTPFIFSPHVFDTDAQGRVVIGHNHAGVWLIDASDPENPVSMGLYQPHEERPGFKGTQPSVWGARFYNGYIVATDGPTGLYVLEAEGNLLRGAMPGRVGGDTGPRIPSLLDRLG